MKTTKKGFTLIELIVVIAIIGVLAAILVPSMLGYVKKSKIQSANTTASSIYKAVNSAATEFDELDMVLKTEDAEVNVTAQTIGTGSGTAPEASAADLYKSVKNYFGDITKCNGAKVSINSEGQCQAVAVSSGKYMGAYPSGVVSTKTWDETVAGFANSPYKGKTVDDVLADAITRATT